MSPLWVAALLAIASPAPRSLAECDSAIRSHPGDHDAYACFLRLAHSWGRGREPVQRHLERWLRDHPDDLLAQLWLGILADANSQADEAVRLLAGVADGFRTRGMDRSEVLARAELANVLCHNGRRSEAEPHLSKLETAAQRSTDPELQANALFGLAACARKDHDHGRAIALYTRARTLLESAPASFPAQRLGNQVLDGLGSALSDSGRHREAFAVFLAESERALDDPFQLAIAQHRLASQAVNLADADELDWDEADRRIQESLDTGKKLSAPYWPANITRIVHAARLGPSAAALDELDAALAYWRPRAAWGVLTALRLRAKFLSDLNPAHPAEALREAEEALTLARSTGNHWNTGMGLLVRSYIRWRSGDRPGGISDALATLEELDRLRDFQADHLVRAWTSSETNFAYPLVAGWLLDPAHGVPAPGDVERAFQSMERHRARVLLETLVSARIAPGTTVAVPPPTLAEVQRALQPDEAVLSFQTWWRKHDQDATYQDGSSWVIVISRDAVRSIRIPDAKPLREQLELLDGLLETRDGAEAFGAARLYRDLLEQALDGLPRGVQNLVLIPDGPLHRLPFEILRDPRTGEPLGTRYALSVVPSAALWLRWRQQPRSPRGASAFGDAPLALVFANPPATVTSPEGAALPPLPSAEREARAIRSALAGRAVILLGDGASERRIKKTRLQGFSILHFAAHALIDEQNPSLSALILSPGAREEDGRLQVGEVARLDLKGRMIVLAACRSASGAVLGGEGPVSLARAFFQAGAPVVIGSSRPLRDDESTELMSGFYSGLARGLPVSRAMLQARRDLHATGAPDAAWAGLTVLGDGAVVPLPGGVGSSFPTVAMAGVAGALLLAAGLVFNARVRARSHPAG